MLKSYFLSAIRNFLKNRTFSLLNVLGLAFGMAASLLIIQYVRYERSFDKFHAKSERIFRMIYTSYRNGEVNFESAAAVPASGPAMKNNFTEVEEFVRLLPAGGIMSYDHPTRGKIAFRETNNIQVTEPSIFTIFDIDLVTGNPKTCIDGPGKIAISKKAAERYFGTENPIGKVMRLDGGDDLEVSAVFNDLPDNSHIKFDFLASNMIFADWDENWEEHWSWYDHNTYVLLKEGVDYKELQSKWDVFLEEVRGEHWRQNDSRQEFILQPMTDIHLYSNLLQESRPEEQGDGDSVYFLTIIAFFIILIAWVNYINLNTAKSLERANEVGVRKVMGAFRTQLTRQFMMEALLVNFVAMLLGTLMVAFAWPFFVEMTGRNLEFSQINSFSFWISALALFLLGTLLSGSYPALIMSSFEPVTVLKGKIFKSSKGAFLRQGLVVFQFCISVILINGTFVVLQQLRFMKNQDLGINIDRTMVLHGPGATDSTYMDRLESFHDETIKISGVKSMTASSNVPGNEIFWTRSIQRLSGNTEAHITVYNVAIDGNYIPSFDLELLAGRNFEDGYGNDDKLIITESLIRILDFGDPHAAIGEFVNMGGDTLEIVGVLADYHQMSLKQPTSPMVFFRGPANDFFSYKIQSENYKDVLAGIEDTWQQFFPGNPIDYFFLDEFYNKQYDEDQRFGDVFATFSFLAIFVACLGLYGLAAFMTSQRTKEIGIRKVLGASIQGIVALLSRGFLKLVIVANVIAIPLSFWLMDNWLNNFPFRIELNWIYLTLSGLLVVLIAIFSVSFQTLKAAVMDPAKTLKYE